MRHSFLYFVGKHFRTFVRKSLVHLRTVYASSIVHISSKASATAESAYKILVDSDQLPKSTGNNYLRRSLTDFFKYLIIIIIIIGQWSTCYCIRK